MSSLIKDSTEKLAAHGIEAPLTSWDDFYNQLEDIVNNKEIPASDQYEVGVSLGRQLGYIFATNPDIPPQEGETAAQTVDRQAKNMEIAAYRLKSLIGSCLDVFRARARDGRPMSNLLQGLGMGLRNSELIQSYGGADIIRDTALDIAINAVEIGNAEEAFRQMAIIGDDEDIAPYIRKIDAAMDRVREAMEEKAA